MMVASGLPVPTCTLLGRAVLWKVFEKSAGEKSAQHCIPIPMMYRVMSAYRDLCNRCVLKDKENPIARLLLGVTGVDMQLIIGVIMTDDVIKAAAVHDWRAGSGLERQEAASLVIHLVYAMPHSRGGNKKDEEAPAALRPVLLSRPKTLHDG